MFLKDLKDRAVDNKKDIMSLEQVVYYEIFTNSLFNVLMFIGLDFLASIYIKYLVKKSVKKYTKYLQVLNDGEFTIEDFKIEAHKNLN
jgi:hypothetical protein